MAHHKIFQMLKNFEDKKGNQEPLLKTHSVKWQKKGIFQIYTLSPT